MAGNPFHARLQKEERSVSEEQEYTESEHGYQEWLEMKEAEQAEEEAERVRQASQGCNGVRADGTTW